MKEVSAEEPEQIAEETPAEEPEPPQEEAPAEKTAQEPGPEDEPPAPEETVIPEVSKLSDDWEDIAAAAGAEPVGEPVLRFGVALSRVRLRVGPGMEYPRVEYLQKGDYVYMGQTVLNEDGEEWTWVRYGVIGDLVREGFAMTKYIRELTQEESDAYAARFHP